MDNGNWETGLQNYLNIFKYLVLLFMVKNYDNTETL